MKNNKAKSFLTIVVVIAVTALLLRVVIEQIIKLNIEQNDSNAQTTLKQISTALENYAKNNNNSFPEDFVVLTQGVSRYLDTDYIEHSPVKGYNYSCSKLEPSGYNCSAVPVKCGLTGKMFYTVTTGGLFVLEKCEKKE